MAICIPKEIKNKIRSAIKSGKINIDELYNLNSVDRRSALSKYVGDESSKLINTEYEKARVIAEKRAMSDYVTSSQKKSFAKGATAGEFGKKLLSSDETKKMNLDKIDTQIKKVQDQQFKVNEKIKSATGENKDNLKLKLNKYKDKEAQLNVRKEDINNPPTDKLIKKINSIKGMLGDEHYSELVSAKMGNDVSPAQGKYIIDKAIELKELAKGNEADSGGISAEYNNARHSLDSYINHLNPDSSVTVLQDLVDIGRNALITGISTPIKVLANYTNFFARRALQRISNMSLRGHNSDIIKELFNDNSSFYKKTGSDRTQFTSMSDTNTILGSHSFKDNENFSRPEIVGKSTSGILGKAERGIGHVARASHFVAIKLEHTLAYNYVFKRTFYDTLKFQSYKLAKLEGLKGADAVSRAGEMIRDANLVEPKTITGKALRASAQELGSFITNTNKTFASDISLGIKNALNKPYPKAHLGDIIEPMAKIPANVIWNGIKNSALGIPSVVSDLVRGRMKITKNVSLETRVEGLIQYQKGLQNLMGIIGSTALGLYITSKLTSQDFKTDRYGGTYVHFGDLWINTEYFGRLAPTISGMMAARMSKKKDLVSTITAFTKGTAVGMLRIPGINSASELVNQMYGKNTGKYLANMAKTRAVPAIGLQAMGTRPINRMFFGAHGVETNRMVAKDKYEAKIRRAKARRATRR